MQQHEDGKTPLEGTITNETEYQAEDYCPADEIPGELIEPPAKKPVAERTRMVKKVMPYG
jgi:hypothetical protein